MAAKKTTKPTAKKTVAKKPSKIAAAGKALRATSKSVAANFISALKSAGTSASTAAKKAVKKVVKKTAETKAKLTAQKKAAKPVAKKPAAVTPKFRSTVTKTKPAAKAAPAPKAAAPKAKAEAPGDSSLTLIARDPRWLYAEWELSKAQQQAVAKKSESGKLALRVLFGDASGPLVKEAKLKSGATHAFLPVARGESSYVAELGYRDGRGQWVTLARSGVVTTPSEEFEPEVRAEFATIPQNVPFRDVFEKVGAQVAKDVPLTEVVRKFRDMLPGFAITPAGTGWTPQKIRTLSRLAGARQIRRRIQSELSSMTAAHILTEEEQFFVEEETEAGGGADSASSPGSSWSGGWSGTVN